MEFKAEFFTFELAFKDLSRTIRDIVNVQMRQAARAFESAALALIPVDTGFAASPFRNIGEAAQSKTTSAAYVFRRKALKAFTKNIKKLDAIEKRVRYNAQLINLFAAAEGNKKAKRQLEDEYKKKLEQIFKLKNKIRKEIFQLKLSGSHGNLFNRKISTRRRGPRARSGGEEFDILLPTGRVDENNEPEHKTSKMNFLQLLQRGKDESVKLGFAHTSELSDDGIPYYYYPGGKVRKSPVEGQKFGTNPKEIFTVSGDKYYFNFANKIIYFRIEDFYGYRSGPWRAMLAGNKAFLNYWKTEGFKRLPFFGGRNENGSRQEAANEFFIKTIVKLKGEGITRETIRGQPGPAAPSRQPVAEPLSTRPPPGRDTGTPEAQSPASAELARKKQRIAKMYSDYIDHQAKNKARKAAEDAIVTKRIAKLQEESKRYFANFERQEKHYQAKQKGQKTVSPHKLEQQQESARHKRTEE